MERTILVKLVVEVRQFHNRDFLKAAMAVCALAAVADNEVKLSERYQIDAILAKEPALLAFDANKATDTLYAYIHDLQTDWRSAADVPTATPESRELSDALRAAGFKFCGPTIVYAFAQACGLVNDHVISCPQHDECAAEADRVRF